MIIYKIFNNSNFSFACRFLLLCQVQDLIHTPRGLIFTPLLNKFEKRIYLPTRESIKSAYLPLTISLEYPFSITFNPFSPISSKDVLLILSSHWQISFAFPSTFASVINLAHPIFDRKLIMGVFFGEQTSKGLPHAIIVYTFEGKPWAAMSGSIKINWMSEKAIISGINSRG